MEGVRAKTILVVIPLTHTPNTAFRKEGCRKPVFGV